MTNTTISILLFAVAIVLTLSGSGNPDVWAVGGWVIYAMGNKHD
jgi:hypothetical protein